MGVGSCSTETLSSNHSTSIYCGFTLIQGRQVAVGMGGWMPEGLGEPEQHRNWLGTHMLGSIPEHPVIPPVPLGDFTSDDIS